MYSKEPVWLLPETIVDRYNEFCFKNNLTEKRLVQLYDAFLLRGRDHRNSKKIEILQESFEILQQHIKYNLMKQGSNNEDIINTPHYLKYKYEIFYDKEKNWYTPSELIDTYSFLKNERHFTSKFIGEMAYIGMIIGKYQPHENCYYIHLPSFVWLIKYREYIVRQYLMLPPPPDPLI
ncbi:MAG: hypothetical protein Q8L81_07575 [Bacteroidota bacterium]|nr:hypothetical protein [Bacteroidota bacterium]